MTRTYGAASSGVISGVGLAIAKTSGSGAIRASAAGGMHAGAREPDEEVHAVDDVGGRALQALGVRVLGVPALDRRHRAVAVVGARRADRAARVAADDPRHARLHEDPRHRDAGRAQADDQHAQVAAATGP